MDGLVWSSNHLDILNSGVTHEEIKNALFSIDDSKAPSPDGSLLFSSKGPGALLGMRCVMR